METAKKKRFNASQYSTKLLMKQGYSVQNVEQTVRWPKKGERMTAQDVVRELSFSCAHQARSCCNLCAANLIEQYAKSNGWEMVKKDLWGFADLIAVKIGEKGVLLVQTTTADHVQDRIQKIAGIVEARTILDAENRIHVHSWRVKGGNGKPKSRQVTVTEIGFDEDGLIVTKDLTTQNFSESSQSQEELDFSF